MGVLDRAKQAWNAFRANEKPEPYIQGSVGASYGHRPDRMRSRISNEKTILTSILTRISIDVAAVELRHVEVNSSGRYSKDVESKLNEALNLKTNLDQNPRSFRQDIAMTIFDKGVAAIVPIDTTIEPQTGQMLDIITLRVGEIVAWYPQHVRVNVYNEVKGIREEITIDKSKVAIVENPLHMVMNQPNSTMQRLIRKLNLLDTVDEASASGKLDLIIQLPYVIKSEARREQAEKRRADIEMQLKGSHYGIAYTDGTEKITQLNRPAENNLLTQIEYLSKTLYGQLGVTEEIMNGTASEQAMLNYYDRTIEPLVDAIAEAIKSTFIADNPKEKILYFKNPFKLVPLSQVAEIADKFARNEILSSNEIRGFLGIPPSDDPKADKLVNSNISQPTEDGQPAQLRKEDQNGA